MRARDERPGRAPAAPPRLPSAQPPGRRSCHTRSCTPSLRVSMPRVASYADTESSFYLVFRLCSRNCVETHSWRFSLCV